MFHNKHAFERKRYTNLCVSVVYILGINCIKVFNCDTILANRVLCTLIAWSKFKNCIVQNACILSSKCNSFHVTIPRFLIKQCSDILYTKIQLYILTVQGLCLFFVLFFECVLLFLFVFFLFCFFFFFFCLFVFCCCCCCCFFCFFFVFFVVVVVFFWQDTDIRFPN